MMTRTQRALNVLMRAVLRSPAHRLVSGRVLEITVTGRKTGKAYRLPVGYVASEDALLIGTAGNWRRNLDPGMRVPVLVGGRRRTATVEIVTDEQRCAGYYRDILAGNPVHGRYAGIRAEPGGGPNRDDLRRALAQGLAVVWLELDRPDEVLATAPRRT
jgi:deazaflavin-dependent oxidoreductase (nitroreductase family)